MNTEKIYDTRVHQQPQTLPFVARDRGLKETPRYTTKESKLKKLWSQSISRELTLRYAFTAVAIFLLAFAVIYKTQSIYAERANQSSPLMDFAFR